MRQEPISITAILTQQANPPANPTNWQRKGQRIHYQSPCIHLEGENDSGTITLHGSGQSEGWQSWVKELEHALLQLSPSDFQADLFEEDGRLIQRLQGP